MIKPFCHVWLFTQEPTTRCICGVRQPVLKNPWRRNDPLVDFLGARRPGEDIYNVGLQIRFGIGQIVGHFITRNYSLMDRRFRYPVTNLSDLAVPPQLCAHATGERRHGHQSLLFEIASTHRCRVQKTRPFWGQERQAAGKSQLSNDRTVQSSKDRSFGQFPLR
jgi:hypothetical protein